MKKAILCVLFGWSTLAYAGAALRGVTPQTYTSPSAWNNAKWDTSHAGAILNLAGLPLGFSDEFDTCDITYDGDNSAHKWWSYNSTLSAFFKFVASNGPVSPFSCSGGILSITLSNPTGTIWQGGSMRSVNPNNSAQGFTYNYAVVVERIRFPVPDTGLQPWLALWGTNGQFKSGPYLEFDGLETGLTNNDLTVQQTTAHTWPGGGATPAGAITDHQFKPLTWTATMFDGNWHTVAYAQSWNWIVLYYDGAEIGRYPALGFDERNQNAVKLDAAIFYNPTASASTVYNMQVDYVRVWTCPFPYTCNVQ